MSSADTQFGTRQMRDVDQTNADERLARLQRLANQMDSRFSLFGIRFGWDAILGVIPGLGDAATTLPAAYIIVESARLGARKRTLARMAVNTGIDLFVGSIPLVGDLFDLGFKAHRKNVALLKSELGTRSGDLERANVRAGRVRGKDG